MCRRRRPLTRGCGYFFLREPVRGTGSVAHSLLLLQGTWWFYMAMIAFSRYVLFVLGMTLACLPMHERDSASSSSLACSVSAALAVVAPCSRDTHGVFQFYSVSSNPEASSSPRLRTLPTPYVASLRPQLRLRRWTVAQGYALARNLRFTPPTLRIFGFFCTMVQG